MASWNVRGNNAKLRKSLHAESGRLVYVNYAISNRQIGPLQLEKPFLALLILIFIGNRVGASKIKDNEISFVFSEVAEIALTTWASDINP